MRIRFVEFIAALALATAPCRAQGTISTVAGSSTCCNSADGGLATNTWLDGASGITIDRLGNLYIWDGSSSRVRKVNTTGIITTVAGNGTAGYTGDGGPATSARLFASGSVSGLAVDAAGNLYISDGNNHVVRKVNTQGIISTVAGTGAPGFLGDGGPATSALLQYPAGIALDAAGNLYIADSSNNRVRKVNTSSGIISTVAGNGNVVYSGDGVQATLTAVDRPEGLTVDSAGNLYIAETSDARVRKVDASGVISTIAGQTKKSTGFSGDGGPATAATLSGPIGLAVDQFGNLYIADANSNSRIRKVNAAGIISTYAGIGGGTASTPIGDGGPATSAFLGVPKDVALDSAGNLYISGSAGGVVRVRKVTAPPSAIPAISTNGVVNGASFLPGVVPNSWATIQGAGLSAVTDTWANSIVNGNLPTTLDGVKVTVGGKPAYLYYISSSQINFVVPDIGTGPLQVTVTNSAGTSAAFTVNSAQYGPAFFSWPNNQAVATRQDFSLAAKNGTFNGATTSPAAQGDVIILWGTGFGPTAPAAPVGVQVPGNQTYSTITLPTVTINNVPATVYGAALAPGFAGLYQVAIQIPASLPDGDWPIVATIGGVSSPNAMILSVNHNGTAR